MGDALQIPSELDKTFTYLGLVTDFNGIDIENSRDYIQIYFHNYIDKVMIYHCWDVYKSKVPAKPPSPIPPDSVKELFSYSRSKEGTKEHKDLEEKAGFNYRTVIGYLLHLYVYCRPDIGYGVTIPSKSSSDFSDYQCSCLRNLSRYLHITRDWGLRIHLEPTKDF